MKKTKETDTVLLVPANSRNEAHLLHSTELTRIFYQFNPTDTTTHTKLHAKGEPRNNLDTPEQCEVSTLLMQNKPHGQTLQST